MLLSLPSDLVPVIERITAKAGLVRALRLPAPSRESLDHKLRIELTHGSTAIEGNTLTLRETQLLIDEGITPASSKQLRELHETLNHDAAVRWIEARVAEERPLTVAAMCEIHRIILRNIDDERAGQYRDARVLVTGAPVPADALPFYEKALGMTTDENDKTAITKSLDEARAAVKGAAPATK